MPPHGLARKRKWVVEVEVFQEGYEEIKSIKAKLNFTHTGVIVVCRLHRIVGTRFLELET
jgi:hypothetical protein